MSFKSDLKQLLKPYYLVNTVLSLSFVFFKQCSILCEFVLNDLSQCEFSIREMEVLFFVIAIVAFRSRKSGDKSMLGYLATSFVYSKIANLVLWSILDYRLGFLYAIAIIIFAIILPQPVILVSDNVTYFSDLESMELELKRGVWCVAFYTVWHPHCISFSPKFSQLSNKYSLDNFRFGKIDIGRFPEAARKFRISNIVNSVQLPTVILFQEGCEIKRAPRIETNGTVKKFVFSLEQMELYFNLDDYYNECNRPNQ